MKRFTSRFVLIVTALACATTPARAEIILTQNASDTIMPANSTWCPSSPTTHADNSYWRRFDLDGMHNIHESFCVRAVEFGVQSASANSGIQPVEVRLHTIRNSDPLLIDRLLPLDSVEVAVANGSLAKQQAAFGTGGIDANEYDLVVEVFTPSGLAAGNRLIIGSNAGGQTAPCYLSAPECGLPQPRDVASTPINFPDMHIYMAVTGVPCTTPVLADSWGRIKSIYR